MIDVRNACAALADSGGSAERVRARYRIVDGKGTALELTSVAKVIAMSTPKEYLAYYKRVKGIA